MKLHFRTDQPAKRAASLHVDGCRHANLRPRVVTDAPLGLNDPNVLDLIERGVPVTLAPCTRKGT